MSFTNPTTLRVGMEGTLFDKRYRVAGRVVMGMKQAGETYYWNEFNLVDTEGGWVTLVFEVTEHGGQWRLFTLFESQYPLTAEDAASKRVGDPLNLDGTDVRITLLAQSRVYYIEGQAPEGEEVGNVARYFNAESAGTMIVVSWTGEEVECYHGLDLEHGAIRAAFNLGTEASLSGFGSLLGSSDSEASSTGWMKLAAIFLVVGLAIVGYLSFRSFRSPVAVVTLSAPAPPLMLGSAGKLNGRNYRLLEHTIVEIAQVGLRYERHEYRLLGEEGNKALLVYGLKPGGKDWFLFTPLEPVIPRTPLQAATMRAGDVVNLQGFVAPVKELFQSTVRQTESAEAADSKNGTVLYGFTAQTGSTVLLVQWNDSGIAFYSGDALPAKEVAGALSHQEGERH